MIKRLISMAAALAVCIMICGCEDLNKKGIDNSEIYGSETAFEGKPHDAAVMFVNVGKADCAIVEIDGAAWLIDTGTKESFVNTCAALDSLGIGSLDGVIITHGHGDHVGGLEPLSQRYQIGRVICPELLLDSKTVAEAAGAHGIPLDRAKAGSSIPIVDGVAFEVLAPETLNGQDDNDNSLVTRLNVNGRTFLFTGDMQTAEDGLLLASGADVKCDVLKVPNHGNRDATSSEFASAAAPLISVISTDTRVDTNSANKRVIARLADSEIYITQKYALGILVTVSPKGEIGLSFPERAETASGVEINMASKAEQSFSVINTTENSIDIGGWFVYSDKGYEVYSFPNGTSLLPGQELIVACEQSPAAEGADLIWHRRKVWSDKKADNAVLCDSNGGEVSRRASE